MIFTCYIFYSNILSYIEFWNNYGMGILIKKWIHVQFSIISYIKFTQHFCTSFNIQVVKWKHFLVSSIHFLLRKLELRFYILLTVNVRVLIFFKTTCCSKSSSLLSYLIVIQYSVISPLQVCKTKRTIGFFSVC